MEKQIIVIQKHIRAHIDRKMMKNAWQIYCECFPDAYKSNIFQTHTKQIPVVKVDKISTNPYDVRLNIQQKPMEIKQSLDDLISMAINKPLVVMKQKQ
ncbi:EF-hand binding site [Hexamita inflata]|uniref:EF-hand binding site n=1 Tax=Hexamita inflata TaxID=28002 RepID=A0AA86R8Y1_9EUKA|nr:EF-hand binding site [Hexamita inflata]